MHSFGVVTKCKKRVDGCFYAVKRTIKRFRGDMAKNQALKEVFALAALPAIPNIVRYFSAWVEVTSHTCPRVRAHLTQTSPMFRMALPTSKWSFATLRCSN